MIGVATAIAVSGYGAFVVLSVPSTPTLTIYAYSSLLGGCLGASTPACQAVFGAFESAHHVRIDLEAPPGTLVSTLVSQREAPRADVVIGLDEITGPQAIAAGVLSPYTPPELTEVNASLVADLGGGGYVTPYEYGYLGLDSNATLGPDASALANWSFPAVARNGTLAKETMIEDPMTDITGEEFLLWEIAFYESVLHQNWQSFWQAADPNLKVAPDWSTAFGDFETPPGNPPMVVSYSTDPAYTAVDGGPAFSTTVGRWNGTPYVWRTTYGLAVVQGTAHPSLAAEFVNWFLSDPVQAQLPLTEFEYPVDDRIALPAAFGAAVPTAGFVPLNPDIPPADRASDLPDYLDAWQSLANQYG